MSSAHCTRNRAWRRQQRDRHIAKRSGNLLNNRRHGKRALLAGQCSKTKGLPCYKELICNYPDKKRWKLLWRRADKLARAKQLKLPYPHNIWQREVVLEAEGE